MAVAQTKAIESGNKLEILVSCQSLKDKDFISKSDPCCILYAERDGNWTEFGRTESVKNTVNPQFNKSFDVDYSFEEVQKLRFAVYDIDNKSAKLTDDDFLGSAECTVGEIVTAGVLVKPLILKPGKPTGKSTITIRANDRSRQPETLLLLFSATKLDKKDLMSKSDPFLEFYRVGLDGTRQHVYRTEVVKNNINPEWRPIEIKASRLCGGDINASITVECLDYENKGSHEFIGSFVTTVAELMEGAKKELKWPLINAKKKTKKKYENSGVVTLKSCQITKDFTFLDYVLGGLQIHLTVGIDFTASNGNPSNPQSLHYMQPDQSNNHYIRAIKAVGDIIKDYDADQMIPALGYGAKIPPYMEVSHAFALNFNPANPFCPGVQGVLDAYKSCVGQVELYGPTNFAPIILHVAQFAAAQKDNTAKNYFILLIITDGVISDLPETLRAIVYASALPFSIVIVGVGAADFKAMDALDGQRDGLLKDDKGGVAKRDMVQFVAYRDFEDNVDRLARKVLSEIPDHVCRYYKMLDIEPSVRSVPAAYVDENPS